MKKFALLVMVALIQLTQASAQRPFVPYEKPLARQGIMSCAPMKKSLRKADLNYNQRLVGYYVTDDYDNSLEPCWSVRTSPTTSEQKWWECGMRWEAMPLQMLYLSMRVIL